MELSLKDYPICEHPLLLFVYMIHTYIYTYVCFVNATFRGLLVKHHLMFHMYFLRNASAVWRHLQIYCDRQTGTLHSITSVYVRLKIQTFKSLVFYPLKQGGF